MDTCLLGKIAFITGAGYCQVNADGALDGHAPNMGVAIAQRLAKMGAVVVATDINEEAAKKTVETLTRYDSNPPHSAMKLDVTKADEIQSVMNKIQEEYKKMVDTLIGDHPYLDPNMEETILAAQQEAVLQKDTAAREYAKEANRLDILAGKVADRHERTRTVSRIVMLGFYLIVLVVAVFLLIRKDVAVSVTYILMGSILIVDGVMNIIFATSAKKKGVYRLYLFSVILSVISVGLGLLFIIFSRKAGILAMQVTSALMIVKSIGDFFVAFRNKAVLSSLSDTVTQIRRQGKENE